MALVLNGSGSITGLSAGGLPDGSVTADDIASTLDLSGKTITNMNPSGIYLGGTGAANYLDDYEEGTWTPNPIQGLTGFSVASARYVKIGAFVFAHTYLTGIAGKDGNQVRMDGLPFNARYYGFSPGVIETDTGGKVGIARTQSSSDQIVFYYANTSTGNRSDLTGNDVGNHIIFSVFYKTDS
jgi:hypothetical protein